MQGEVLIKYIMYNAQKTKPQYIMQIMQDIPPKMI